MTRDLNGVRLRLLDAALDLLRREGLRALTQPRVAAAAGVSQSHLTHYFRRRNDLVLAVAQHASAATFAELQGVLVAHAAASQGAAPRARALSLVRLLMGDRARSRLLLALAIEADEDPEIRAAVHAWVAMLRGLVAMGLGKTLDDPDVDLALATLWGLGLQHLVLGDARDPAFTDALLHRAAERLAPSSPPTESH